VSPEAVNLGILNAAAKAELKPGPEALQRILPLLDSRPDDAGLLLTAIQLHLQQSQPNPAIALLEAYFKRQGATDARFAPGIVALAVALYGLQGRPAAQRRELAAAAGHWRSRDVAPPATLLREAGIALLRSSDPADLTAAGEAFARLASSSSAGGDRASTAGLVASFATTDYSRVEPHLDSLTPVDELTKGIDAAALLAAGVASLAPTEAASTSKKRSAAAEAAGTAAKRKRRNKPPKDLDPNRKPDPERWLPLRDRSSYRPPKGRGKGGKRRGGLDTMQGGTVREEETLELAGGAGSVKVQTAAGGGGGGGGAAKKKKKGKR
jgi:signal recognition particle subunit SRP72